MLGTHPRVSLGSCGFFPEGAVFQFSCGLLSQLLGLVRTVPEAIALGLAVSLSSTAVLLQCLPSIETFNARDSPSDRMTATRQVGEDPTVSCTHSLDSPRSRKFMLGLLVFQDVTIGLILALLPT